MKLKPIYSIIIIFISLNFNCDNNIGNRKPEIKKIIINPSTPIINQKVELIIDVSDKDGDSLSFHWIADSNQFVSDIDKDTVIWLSPNHAGKYYLTVKVSDGKAVAKSDFSVTVYRYNFNIGCFSDSHLIIYFSTLTLFILIFLFSSFYLAKRDNYILLILLAILFSVLFRFLWGINFNFQTIIFYLIILVILFISIIRLIKKKNKEISSNEILRIIFIILPFLGLLLGYLLYYLYR